MTSTILRPFHLAAFICFIATPAIHGQGNHVVLGDARVNGLRIQPYTAQWEMYDRRPDGTERMIGFWLDSTDVVSVKGQTLLRRRQVALDTARRTISRQVHLVDRQTLAPVRSHFASKGSIKHMDFDRDTPRGFILASDEAPAVFFEGPVDQQAFDFEIAGTLLVGFTIQASEELSFETYDVVPTSVGNNGFPNGLRLGTRTVDLTSHGVETVFAGKLGEVDTTRVVVEQGRRTLTFWLADVPPYIIRLTSELPTGTTIWSLR